MLDFFLAKLLLLNFFSLHAFGTDDIEIDEPIPVASTSSHDSMNIKTGK